MMGWVEWTLCVLAAFGLGALLALVTAQLLLPLTIPVRILVPGRDGGEGLEQTVRALLWLRRTGLWRGQIVLRDEGLTPDGIQLARRLCQWEGVRLDCPAYDTNTQEK